MYGFFLLNKNASGEYEIVPSDANADYPSGSTQQNKPCSKDQ
jgi:hypothetical protein